MRGRVPGAFRGGVLALTNDHRTTRTERPAHRLRVIFRLRVREGAEERFLGAYREIRHRVARVDGYLGDQLCQSTTDVGDWVITSEWESHEHFLRWESGSDHRELAAPLMECVSARESLRYHVRLATAAGRGADVDQVLVGGES
jgi:heme-degrading monooxygenase HmoA